MTDYVSDTKTDFLTAQLEDLKAQGLFNNIRTIESPMDGHIVVDGKQVLNFCANNYLGLANHPRLREAAKRAIDQYGIGPGAVRTIAGTMSLHVELENRLAQFKGAEAVITLQSGFTANLATIPALVGKGDAIFSDALNHASIIDGCRLSGATIVGYAHNDMNDLREKIDQVKAGTYVSKSGEALGATPNRRHLIISDGVFSMDGDIAPLPELYEIAKEHNFLLMVDDAHGEGVLGRGGRGIVDHFHLHGKVDIEVGTMSKAFGSVGGIVAGRKVIIDWLRQRARPFLFSSAMTVPDVAVCLEAVEMLESSEELVQRLWSNAEFLKRELKNLGFDIGQSTTPIIPLMLGEAPLAQQFSRKLFENGVFAMAIGFPTVAKGKARIRVMNTAAHSQDDLEQALVAFETVGKELGVIR
jgi:glycine C-acetyltransferase